MIVGQVARSAFVELQVRNPDLCLHKRRSWWRAGEETSPGRNSRLSVDHSESHQSHIANPAECLHRDMTIARSMSEYEAVWSLVKIFEVKEVEGGVKRLTRPALLIYGTANQ